jgi:hypothetical protein
MNRKELAAAVHAGTDGLRGMAAANAAVDIIIKTITAALAAGENFEINSFGKFVHVNGPASSNQYLMFQMLFSIQTAEGIPASLSMNRNLAEDLISQLTQEMARIGLGYIYSASSRRHSI